MKGQYKLTIKDATLSGSFEGDPRKVTAALKEAGGPGGLFNTKESREVRAMIQGKVGRERLSLFQFRRGL
jgi:hypothetical protein